MPLTTKDFGSSTEDEGTPVPVELDPGRPLREALRKLEDKAKSYTYEEVSELIVHFQASEFQVGWDAGYSQGFEEGDDAGREFGRDDGYSEGYDEGYQVLMSQQPNVRKPLNPINRAYRLYEETQQRDEAHNGMRTDESEA